MINTKTIISPLVCDILNTDEVPQKLVLERTDSAGTLCLNRDELESPKKSPKDPFRSSKNTERCRLS